MATLAITRMHALVAVLALAGCASHVSPLDASATNAAGPAELGSPSNHTATAPLMKGTASPTPTQHNFTIAWTGAIGTHACVPTGPNACTYLPGSTPGDDRLVIGQLDNGTWQGRVVLSWTASTPATQTLELSVAIVTGCGPGCESQQALATSQGQSPLELVMPLTPTNGTVRIQIDVPTVTPPPLYMDLAVDQGFQVEGQLRAEA